MLFGTRNTVDFLAQVLIDFVESIAGGFGSDLGGAAFRLWNRGCS
jgi:hypothetical protein